MPFPYVGAPVPRFGQVLGEHVVVEVNPLWNGGGDEVAACRSEVPRVPPRHQRSEKHNLVSFLFTSHQAEGEFGCV